MSTQNAWDKTVKEIAKAGICKDKMEVKKIVIAYLYNAPFITIMKDHELTIQELAAILNLFSAAVLEG